MAENSKREAIILSDIALIESIPAIKTVARRLPSFSDLQSFASTQFPAVAVVGRIPVPVNHVQSRNGQVDLIVSELRVDAYVFIHENVNADAKISNILDDFWAVLYTNPTRNNLCMFTSLEATETTETWPPFVAFQLTCFHKYQHSIGGI